MRADHFLVGVWPSLVANTHQAMAHRVNGIAIVELLSRTVAESKSAARRLWHEREEEAVTRERVERDRAHRTYCFAASNTGE